MYSYRYPHPAVTADTVVLRPDGPSMLVLLIQRKNEPEQGRWAFPGGFVEIDEDLEDAARRELHEETGLGGMPMIQVGAFGAPDRDPRERIITVAFLAVIGSGSHNVVADSDAAAAEWFPVHETPPLAFDHEDILEVALSRFRELNDRGHRWDQETKKA